jgi:inner membrane protease subunit 1
MLPLLRSRLAPALRRRGASALASPASSSATYGATPSWTTSLWHLLKFIAVLHVTSEYVAETTLTKGPSMLPTLSMSGDIVLVDKTFNLLWFRNYRRGDIVVAKSPTNPAQYVCKRIVAMGGERAPSGRLVPGGRVWLEGDNKSNSIDSRDYGAIPEALIVGRVVLRIWPYPLMGRLA